MAVPKPMLTEYGIHHRFESCASICDVFCSPEIHSWLAVEGAVPSFPASDHHGPVPSAAFHCPQTVQEVEDRGQVGGAPEKAQPGSGEQDHLPSTATHGVRENQQNHEGQNTKR